MGSKSLVSHDCLSAWEVILPERLDPIKRFAKIERNFELNQISFDWGFAIKRFDNRFRSYQVEFGKELRFKKLLVEVIQESVTKMSANYGKKVRFYVRYKKAENRRSKEDMYVISEGEHMILTISSLISIGYVKIVFDEQSNAFVNTARTTLKFTVIRQDIGILAEIASVLFILFY